MERAMNHKLSERIQSGENTPELREAIAVVAGWIKLPQGFWVHGAFDSSINELPDYLTDIRLTLSDIERRGMGCTVFMPSSLSPEETIHVRLWLVSKTIQVDRMDRDLARCACEAYVRALENDDAK
jgi:hypothetical protein